MVFIGTLQPSALHHGWAGLATNSGLIDGPLAFITAGVGLAWWATILRVDAFISPAGTGMIYQTSTSRVGYGLARNRYYPQVFAMVDRNGVPWVSLIFAFVFGLVFLLPFPSWSALVTLVTSASVLMYAGAPLSLGALRRQVPDAPRPYRLPVAAVVAPVEFVIAGEIIYWSGFETIWKLGIVLVIGYILIGISMIFDKQRPPLDWKSAQWLPVYLIGMGIVSWQGQFGPDMAIVAGFSLVIYFWAQAVRNPRSEVLRLVSRQAAEPEPNLPSGH